jgi:hypothetical protein
MMEILANLMRKTGYQLLMCLGYFHVVPNVLLVQWRKGEQLCCRYLPWIKIQFGEMIEVLANFSANQIIDC